MTHKHRHRQTRNVVFLRNYKKIPKLNSTSLFHINTHTLSPTHSTSHSPLSPAVLSVPLSSLPLSSLPHSVFHTHSLSLLLTFCLSLPHILSISHPLSLYLYKSPSLLLSTAPLFIPLSHTHSLPRCPNPLKCSLSPATHSLFLLLLFAFSLLSIEYPMEIRWTNSGHLLHNIH